MTKHDPPLIGIVGVCASGKSTLIRGLETLGYRCRHIAQEHSYVPDMWQRLTNPDLLVYLEVSYEKTLQRKNLNWSEAEYQIQVQRLEHAHWHAQLVIQTDELEPDELIRRVSEWVEQILTTPTDAEKRG